MLVVSAGEHVTGEAVQPFTWRLQGEHVTGEAEQPLTWLFVRVLLAARSSV